MSKVSSISPERLSKSPTTPPSSRISSVTSVSTLVGSGLVFTFPRADASETPDIAVQVETGTDLNAWPVTYLVGADTESASPGVAVVENGSDPDTITVTIPKGSDAKKFARLKVTVTP
jgi:hypothetical protein